MFFIISVHLKSDLIRRVAFSKSGLIKGGLFAVQNSENLNDVLVAEFEFKQAIPRLFSF